MKPDRKPDRLEWAVWSELLAVCNGCLQARIRTPAVKSDFEKILLNRPEAEFAKGGNFWLDTVRDRAAIALPGVADLKADALALAAVDAVELAAWLETVPSTQPSALADAMSALLQAHAADYSKTALSSAARFAHALLADAAAQWVNAVLKARRVFDAHQVMALAQGVTQAAEFAAAHPQAAEVFPFGVVLRQLQKQSPTALTPALSGLQAMSMAVAKLGALSAAERKSRAALQSCCQELLAVAQA